MAKTDGSGTKLLQSGVVPNSTEYGRFRVRQLRGRVGQKVGTAEGLSRTPLTKPTLNSTHAYLTGEFIVDPQFLGTGLSPSRETMMRSVADAAGIETYDPVSPTPPEGVDPEDDDIQRPTGVRPFRKAELIKLCEELDDTPDQREWTP